MVKNKNKLNLHKYMFGGSKRKHSILNSVKKFTSQKINKEKSKVNNGLKNISNIKSKISKEFELKDLDKSKSKLDNDSDPKVLDGLTSTSKSIFNSNFTTFFKNYIFFIILFSICFYILLYIYKDSNNKVVVSEAKVFFYLVIIFLFIIINDLMSIPIPWLDKFFIYIFLPLLIEYIIINLIDHYYKNEPFHTKLFKVFISALIVGLIAMLNIYFLFQKKNEKITFNLYNSFNYAINKNIFFLIYLTIFVFIFYFTYYWLNLNSYLSDIIQPTILGSLLLFIVFSLILYIIYRLKIINKLQILNGFISLYSLLFFFSVVFIYIFMGSVSTICTTNETLSQKKENDYVAILILISIFIILWYDDSRNWHQKGSILFIFATIVTFYTTFYYSISHPNTSLLSLWLFIEWIIIFFRRKENTQNAFNYSFMKT